VRKSDVYSRHIENIWSSVRFSRLFLLHPNSFTVGLDIGSTRDRGSELEKVGAKILASTWINLEKEKDLAFFRQSFPIKNEYKT